MKRFSLALALTSCCAACTNEYTLLQHDSYSRAGFSPSQVNRVAIVDRDVERGDAGRGDVRLWEALNQIFMRRGVQCVERSKIAALVREQQMINKDFSDLGDIERATRIGGLLNVDHIIYGDSLFIDHKYKHTLNPKRQLLWLLGVYPLFTPVVAPLTLGRTKGMDAEANETGIPPALGSGKFCTWAESTSCNTVRAIDVATGEIVWVGYAFMASRKRVTLDNASDHCKFGSLLQQVDLLVDTFLSGRSQR